MNRLADTHAPLGFAPAAQRSRLARAGEAMARHKAVIQGIQWTVVAFYLSLVIIPAFQPLPAQDAHVYNNLTLFAQFVFWGLWWPGVMLSMMLMGRVWCGVFCPEGALTEFVSRHGLGKAIPRWLRWSGWPFVAFLSITVYGQLVSVYEYSKAALLILGGSTVAAVAIGFVYGKGKRVWCRYLCPASGVFALLSKLAPLHFRVDEQAWKRYPARLPSVDCAPLVDMRHMHSASQCHACGRCSGYRNAIELAARPPNREILALTASEISRWQVALLVFGLLGIATGAFQWSMSPYFVAIKQGIGGWLVEHEWFPLLQDNAPWWLLTHYPEANDVFTWLDGVCVLGYIGASALISGGWIMSWLWAAQKFLARPNEMWRLAYSLLPMAGVGVFLGLTMLTVTMLKAEGVNLQWVHFARAALAIFGVAWSLWLAGKMILPAKETGIGRRLAACIAMAAAMAAVAANWAVMFFVW